MDVDILTAEHTGSGAAVLGLHVHGLRTARRLLATARWRDQCRHWQRAVAARQLLIVGRESAIGAISTGPEDERAVAIVVRCYEAWRSRVAARENCVVVAESVYVADGGVGRYILDAEEKELGGISMTLTNSLILPPSNVVLLHDGFAFAQTPCHSEERALRTLKTN